MIQNGIGQTSKGNINWWLAALGLENLLQTVIVEVCFVLLLFLFMFSLSLAANFLLANQIYKLFFKVYIN